MSRFDDMIHGLQQDIEVPDEVWKKYTDTLSKLPDKQEDIPHSFSKRKIWPVMVAATLAVGVVGVSASVYRQWSRGLEDGLQTTEEQRQKLEDTQMASFVGQSVTQGNVTVTAQQSIVDNYFAYLSFKVEGYEVEEGQQPGFSSIGIVVDNDEDYTGGWTASFYNGIIPGENGKAIHDDGTPLTEGELENYTLEDGSMEFQVTMMSDKKGSFIGKSIHVELKDLGIYPGKAEAVVPDVEGNWSFDWVLTGSEEIETCELNTTLGDSGATVQSVELSPISISVSYEFPRQEETETYTDENGEEVTYSFYAEPPAFTGVRLKDGTIYTALCDGGTEGYETEDSDIYKCINSLTRVIDVEQVESLLFIKSYPEGEGEQTIGEENLYFVAVK